MQGAIDRATVRENSRAHARRARTGDNHSHNRASQDSILCWRNVCFNKNWPGQRLWAFERDEPRANGTIEAATDSGERRSAHHG
jgi:hypothetical protein